jgi:glyoxylase-like metal-dependent hydrolase (beta-lactamase superfamily II)
MKKARLREAGTGDPEVRPVNPAPGVWMIPSFGNTGVIETRGGLVLVDVPGIRWIGRMQEMLRQISDAPIDTIFLTHGHLDHALSLSPIFEEARQKGHRPPKVIAHRNLPARFNRYRMLDGYHDHINRIQFAVPPGVSAFPMPEVNPDITFDRNISLTVGGLDIHAYHDKGETDDALWVWVPEKKTVFSGDLVIFGIPNIGNPFKVQRYTLKWAQALESIIAKEPEVLIPGHSNVIIGKDNIRHYALTVSKALRYLHDEVVSRLNAGMWYEDILHEVDLPEEMKQLKELSPIYGHPKFIIHGVLREYAGWYDGNPCNLFSPKRSVINREIVALAGKGRIVDRVQQLKAAGDIPMALQLVDMLLCLPDLDDGEKRGLHGLKGELLGMMGDKETSYIARNIYYNGHNEEVGLSEKEET